MPLDAGFRLVAEGSGDVIVQLPLSAPVLATDDEIVLSEDGGAATTYKVEKVQYVADYTDRSTPSLPDVHSIYGRVDYIVSVVP